MKCPSCISLLLCCIFGLAACTGPVILDEEEKTEAEQGSTVPVRDSVPIIHEGTYDSPYTIAEAQTLGHGKSVWIEGYIVGCCETSSMNNGCNFEPEAMSLSNILLADTFLTGNKYDYLYCFPVELPKGSHERNDLNLYDNPDNYHRKVRIQGKLTLYFKEVGMIEVSKYIFYDENIPENDEENEDGSSDIEQNDTVKTEEPSVRDSVPIIHEGTYDSPYTIAEAQTLGHGKSVWIEGYIVGCVSGSMKNGCNYTRKATTLSNILLADTFPTGTDYDYLYCLPVELPNNSAERDDLNIYDNPDNYHRKVRIEGDITLYYNVAGMKEICDYSFADENENEDEDEEIFDDEETEIQPDTPNDPDATRQDTLSIAEGIKRQSEKEYNQVYIKGYVVGYYNNSYIRFNPSIEEINTLARNNIVLADNINERDEYNVVIVDLPTGTALREQVNLKDNPQNLYHMLTVKGKMTKFRETNYHGCMETLSKYLDDEDYYFSIE